MFRISKIYEAIKKKIFYNSILRYSLQSYLKTVSLAMTTIRNFDIYSSKGKAFNTSFGVILIFAAMIYPLWVYYFIRKNQASL